MEEEKIDKHKKTDKRSKTWCYHYWFRGCAEGGKYIQRLRDMGLKNPYQYNGMNRQYYYYTTREWEIHAMPVIPKSAHDRGLLPYLKGYFKDIADEELWPEILAAHNELIASWRQERYETYGKILTAKYKKLQRWIEWKKSNGEWVEPDFFKISENSTNPNFSEEISDEK